MSKLKERRIAAGMTQKSLSEKTGVNLQMIRFYEQGVNDINKAEALTVLKLADALGCEVRDILE